MIETRENIIKILAGKYFEFLISLKYEDHLYMKGINEGQRKFLTNLHIYLATQNLPRGYKNKLYTTDYITNRALDKLKVKDFKGLEYEHLVPKKQYIQDVCESRAKEGTLNQKFVEEILNMYLWTATVTKEEHDLLSSRVMPSSWDTSSIAARYEAAGIKLLINEKNTYLS
ncbi:hypothetical protein D5E69_23055 (plasmid) [Rossellomorea marisflavi]|uniref:hypothetical protein n=1 Tax=Rossellomorea marisflavi TaxID=189381 RepID=UPI0013180F56|nr:hypothetical protein [Rossellomorea marisflavi]QHA38715.1 hypothetical protein D5E69_23055 [Rossellomorea marisflavi]